MTAEESKFLNNILLFILENKDIIYFTLNFNKKEYKLLTKEDIGKIKEKFDDIFLY